MKIKLLVLLVSGVLLFGCLSNATPTTAPVIATQLPSVTPNPPTFTPVPPVASHTPLPSVTAIPLPTEIVPGAVLFEEDFEDGKADNFAYIADGFEVTTEGNGNKVLEIDKSTEADIKNNEGGGVGFGSMQWENYSAEYRVKMLNSRANTWLSFRSGAGDEQDYYVEWLSAEWDAINLFFSDGQWQNIKSLELAVWDERWYQIKVEAQGPALRVYLDDTLMIQVKDSRVIRGGFNLGIMPGTHAQFDDVRVIALDETP